MVDSIHLKFYLTQVRPITQLLLTICKSEGKRVGFLPTWYKYVQVQYGAKFPLTITGPVTTWKIAPDSVIKFCEEQKKIWPFFKTPFGSVWKINQLYANEIK
jgi:hypothetical protein